MKYDPEKSIDVANVPAPSLIKSGFHKQYKRFKTVRKRIFEKWYRYSKNITWLKKTIVFQHRYIPIPLFIYDYLFRLNITKVILNFYGYHVWQLKYNERAGSHLSYWNSKESLYWHFWRQTDKGIYLAEILKIPQIKACLEDNELTACELGFGLGKYYRQQWHNNKLKKYLAVDTNKYICEYNKKYYKRHKNLEIINSSAEDFINSEQRFDILISSGEVFAYIKPILVDHIIHKLKEKAVKVVIILEEGTMNDDIVWPDGTIEYNFKQRLMESGYSDKQYYIQEHENRVLKYIVMC
ncbi:MAG: hypothetical protein P4L27_00480 [Ignavibacteriaceae bacterium]|nr:hypothetical protein [Ignavibacteriaceae bacterium]